MTNGTDEIYESITDYQHNTGRCYFCRDHLGSCLCCDECHENQDNCECEYDD